MDTEIVLTTSSSDTPLSHIGPKAPTFKPSPLSFTLSKGGTKQVQMTVIDNNTDDNTATGMGPDTQLSWNAAIIQGGSWATLDAQDKTGTFQLSAQPGAQTTLHVNVNTGTLVKGKQYDFTLSFTLTSKHWGKTTTNVTIPVSIN